MFGVLIVTETRPPFLKRLLLRLFPSRGQTISQHSYRMASYRVGRVIFPTGLKNAAKEKRVVRAMLELRRGGVRRLITAPCWNELALSYGFMPVETSELRFACASRAVLAVCKKAGKDPQRVCVTVCSETMDRRLSDQLLTLAASVRTMRLRCPMDLPILRQRLFDVCGIAAEGALPKGAPEVAMVLSGAPPERAELAVDLTDLSHKNWVAQTFIPVFQPPADILRRCPEETDKIAFLNALYLCGGISAHEVGLDIIESTQYNSGEN